MGILDVPGVSKSQLNAAIAATFKPKTLRNTATRCRTCNQNSVSFTQMNSRTYHVNRGGSLAFVQLVFGNWYASQTSENSFGTTMTITASVEYPAGVFTQVKFSGVAQGTILNGLEIVSDKCFHAIPDNAGYWINSYVVNTAGIYVSPAGVTVTGGRAGEYCEAVASGGVDRTMTGGGVNSPPFTRSAYYPLAILGMSNVESIGILGDSRASGQGDDATNNINLYDMGEIARSIGRALPYTLIATPGDALYNFLTRLTKRVRITSYHTHIHSQYGINDLSQGRTAAQLESDLLELYAKFPSKGVTQSTLTVQTSSTNGTWIDQVHQQQVTSSQPRLAVNTWIRTKPAPLIAFFDVALVTQMPTDQLRWKWSGAVGAEVQWTVEGTHLNEIANVAVADSGCIDTSVYV